MTRGLTRRGFLGASAAGILSLASRARGAEGASRMLEKPIPSTGEPLPAIGLGTWQTFDAGPSAAERAPLAEVLRRLLRGGGRVVDSSPMYGRAESVVGDLLAAEPGLPRPFLATKVWTTGWEAGEAQLRASMRRMRTDRLDLVQVHNLLDHESHLPVLRAGRAAGLFRYLGITHFAPSAFPAMERLLETRTLDFVQLPYSIANREAERLRQCLKAANFDATSQGLRVSASFGAATAQDGDGVDDIVKRCDLALYRAKAQGRDRVVSAPPAQGPTED